MPTVSEQLRDWLARVEILARGVELHRIEAVRALDEARPWEARTRALAILRELRDSPVGLLLWADAAEMMMLDNEAEEALARLAEQLPFRADLWLRLASVRARLGQDSGPALEAAAGASEPIEAADAACLRLVDADLAANDSERAARWLERLSLRGRDSIEAKRKSAAILLENGSYERAFEVESSLPEPDAVDSAGWLLRARLLLSRRSPLAAHAFVRTLLLDPLGAERYARDFIMGADADSVARLRDVLASLGHADRPAWRAAFALSTGDRAGALLAIAEGARRSPELWQEYLELSIELRESNAFLEALELARSVGAEVRAEWSALEAALRAESPPARLSALDHSFTKLAEWASALRRASYEEWLFDAAAIAWRELFEQAATLLRRSSDLEALRELERIQRQLETPLAVAVLGEFNAGKSSFINALLDDNVAPTGILPTTANLNRLVWAAERFARIEHRGGKDDALVSHALLQQTLAALPTSEIERVVIYAPLEPLRQLELIDTPGLNSLEQAHTQTTQRLLKEVELVLWLCDATQPLKASESRVLSDLSHAGVPLVVLLSKADRLTVAEQIEAAEMHVASELARLGIAVEAAPFAFSARAKRSEVGHRSWQAVERLLEDVFAGHRGAYKAQAVLRRTAAVLERLLSWFEQKEAEQSAIIERHRERARALRSAAIRLDAERATHAAALKQWLQTQTSAVLRDLGPLSPGALDGSSRSYVSARLRSRLLRSLSAELIQLARLPHEAREHFKRELELRLGAAVAALAPWLTSASEIATEQLAEVALRELGMALHEASNLDPGQTSLPEAARTRDLLAVVKRAASR